MWVWIIAGIALFLLAVVVYDLVQREHAILHNWPILGHLRYLLESVGPELRQYIVTDNDEERPFSRDQRRWIYATAKKENSNFGFGSDNDMELTPNYLIIKPTVIPLPTPQQAGFPPDYPLPCAKILGGHRGRAQAFRPASIVNISGMSFGSLSGAAVEALNRGAKLAGCLQNTGEGGISPYHQHGGELIWQIGSGYFGCRDERGDFSLTRFKEAVAANPVRAIEIKLSQGAKPGMGGLLPATKVTAEIAAIRGVPAHQDCVSPAAHAVFSDADSMLDFVEMLAHETGLPVGIKSAVGQLEFWEQLAHLMASTHRGVDFITIDGGEGGTGAGPLVFTDHVALPFKIAMSRVYRIFVEEGMHQHLVFIGSAKLGFPESALIAMALGCDMVNVGREAMLAIGCIQAQRCHTGHCPTGVATQSRWLMRGLDPTLKSARLANYVVNLRHELLRLCCACGVPHPAMVTSKHLEFMTGNYGSATPMEMFGYKTDWGLPSDVDQTEIHRTMAALAGMGKPDGDA